MALNDAPKPCPFCGYSAPMFSSDSDGWRVICGFCGARGPAVITRESGEAPSHSAAMIREWNRRERGAE